MKETNLDTDEFDGMKVRVNICLSTVEKYKKRLRESDGSNPGEDKVVKDLLRKELQILNRYKIEYPEYFI